MNDITTLTLQRLGPTFSVLDIPLDFDLKISYVRVFILSLSLFFSSLLFFGSFFSSLLFFSLSLSWIIPPAGKLSA